MSQEVEVTKKIEGCDADQVDELSFLAYGRLVSILRKTHLKYGNHTGAEYSRMMDDGDKSKLRDQLMEIWFGTIKSPGPETGMLPPSYIDSEK